MTTKNDFQEIHDRIKTIIILWVKRIYVATFNIYAWYWLYRQIFIRQSTDFEEYLLWFFATVGMYYFVLENTDLKILPKNKKL